MIRVLKRLLGDPDVTLPRIGLAGAWEIEPGSEPSRFVRALAELLPVASLLVLEGSSMSPDVRESLRTNEVSPDLAVERGTIWPRSALLYLEFSRSTLSSLFASFETHPTPEVCDHLYVVGRGQVIVEWHDAFMGNPLVVAETVPEEVVSRFAEKLGVPRRRVDADPAGSAR